MTTSVKLAKLTLSPINVRKRPDDLLEIPQMAADLEARGVLQNLLVTPVKKPRGTFEVFAEIDAANGGYQGYVTPFFRDLEFEPVPDKNIVKRAAAAVADAVTNVLRNDESEVATKIPFDGNFENTDVDVWTSIESVLRNAFIQSLREGLEGWRS